MTAAGKSDRLRVPASLSACIATLLAGGLLIAACGGSASPSSSAGHAAATNDPAGNAVAFAACMRRTGSSGYPDPQVSQSAGARSRSGSHRAGSIPTPRRSGLPREGAVTSCPDHPQAQSARATRRRTSRSRPACVRTESRASPTPTATARSPSPQGPTSRRPSSSARPKHVSASSQARSRSSSNLQVPPEQPRDDESATRRGTRHVVARSWYRATMRGNGYSGSTCRSPAARGSGHRRRTPFAEAVAMLI